MKAVVYEKSNLPDHLVFRDVEKPTPADNEVLVRIHAASVNSADSRAIKMGLIPRRKILGADIAGQVEAVGKNIRRFSVGDLVLGDISAFGMGGFAQYVAVPESPLVLKPAGLSFQTAAALPMAAVTALQGLRNLGRIKPGDKVLIYGAGGGVGPFAVQLAKYFAAQVTAVCGEKNAEIIKSLGADHVINYHRCDVAKSGQRYDLILAVNGSRSLFTYRRLLTSRGICVVVGGSLKQIIKAMALGKLLSIGNKKLRSLHAKPNAYDLAFVIGLAEEGKLRAVIDRVYPLARTAEALRYQSEGHALGKIIIEVV
ncbi:MAG: NAD(P)-dependent alcohol dehydrogenase [Clostridiales bacterium]|nr:NAD(P)-dependent alcohol dehydrogenase [Clostridiales bacterium]